MRRFELTTDNSNANSYSCHFDAIPPLYGSVPHACKVDPKLYELIVLVDAIRDGRARERQIAIKEIQSRIS
jgi:hypothetical protein